MPSKLSTKLFSRNFVKVFFLSLLILALLLFFQEIYHIKNIQIEADQNQNVLGWKKYKNQISLFLNSNQITKELEEKNPGLKIKQVKIALPNTLVINVIQNKGAADIKASRGLLTIDKNAKIIKKSENNESNLPVITYYQKFDYLTSEVGSKLDFNDLIFTLQILDAIENFGYQINSIDIQGPTMIVLNLSNQKKIVVSSQDSVSDLQNKLNVILKQLRIRGTDFSQLDLRFNKPVVIF